MEHTDIITEVTTTALQMGNYDLDEITYDVTRSLEEAIDSDLIYNSDILEQWNGDTHENVDYDGDLLEAIRQSVYYQILDQHLEIIDREIAYSIEEYATENFSHRPELDQAPDAETLLNFIASGGKDYGQN